MAENGLVKLLDEPSSYDRMAAQVTIEHWRKHQISLEDGVARLYSVLRNRDAAALRAIRAAGRRPRLAALAPGVN